MATALGKPGHMHAFFPHVHGTPAEGLPWCSGRYWCTGCREWITGPHCKGTRAVLPDKDKVKAAARTSG